MVGRELAQSRTVGLDKARKHALWLRRYPVLDPIYHIFNILTLTHPIH